MTAYRRSRRPSSCRLPFGPDKLRHVTGRAVRSATQPAADGGYGHWAAGRSMPAAHLRRAGYRLLRVRGTQE